MGVTSTCLPMGARPSEEASFFGTFLSRLPAYLHAKLSVVFSQKAHLRSTIWEALMGENIEVQINHT